LDETILAAAEQSRADRLLTEDLSHAARIAGIEIVDPFR
jgi:predicted nucleic acid-binding protein